MEVDLVDMGGRRDRTGTGFGSSKATPRRRRTPFSSLYSVHCVHLFPVTAFYRNWG